MRILKYKGKLVEEIARTCSPTVELRILRDEDKEKCPHCDKPIETIINIVEGCRNWETDIEGVKTLMIKELKKIASPNANKDL